MSEELKRLTREELNERAAKLGIDGAALPTKAAVVEAISAGQASPAAGDRSPSARRARMLRQRRARGQL